jgi:hypothetical protein
VRRSAEMAVDGYGAIDGRCGGMIPGYVTDILIDAQEYAAFADKPVQSRLPPTPEAS